MNKSEEVEPEAPRWCKIRLSTLKSMSVEPAGFLVIMSLVMCHLIFQNVMMQTICQVDLKYPEERCAEIINKLNASYKTEEREIQKVMAGLSAYTSVIFCTITVLVVLFIGPWSDANGRKVPLMISMSGLASFPLITLICYFMLGKLTALQQTLIVMIPITASGGGVVFGMSAYSYLSDTTSTKDRTLRTGILSAAMRSGTPLGFAVGGTLTKLGVGVVPSLLFAAAIAIGALLLLLFTVKSIKPAEAEKEVGESKKKQSAWIKYNPITKLIQAFVILFQKRPERHIFWILIICYICYAAPGSGEHSMTYLFVRERLSWGISEYGFFSMANWLMSAGGVVLSMFILSRKLKIPDAVVGFVGGISQICGSTLYAFASTPIMMYSASTLDMMNGTIGVIVRSMLSKTVRPDEVGKMFALLGVIESLLPLLMVPAYALTYRSTNTTFAGAFFFISVGVTLPAEVIFLYFMCKKTDPKVVVKDEELQLGREKPDTNEICEEHEKNGTIAEMAKLMPQEIHSSHEVLAGVYDARLRRFSATSN